MARVGRPSRSSVPVSIPRTAAALYSVSFPEALQTRELLGAAIRSPKSYWPWFALAKAMSGLPLDEREIKLYRECTARQRQRVRRAVQRAVQFAYLICGRRSGKSFFLALVAIFQALFKNWRQYLSPGERAVVLIVAADREQAKIVKRYCSGILTASPLLKQFVVTDNADSIELSNNVIIEVVTCSYRTVRGRSVCVALLDEAAFFRSDESVNPDYEVLNAVRAAMATFGDEGVVIISSSPYSKKGIVWEGYTNNYGKDDDRTLLWKAASWTMNPSLSQRWIDDEYERDRAAAEAELGADFRSDLDTFVSREIVMSRVMAGRYELPPTSSNHYVGFCDPAGGGPDSFTLAISHREGSSAILDVIRDRRGSPEAAVEEYAQLLRNYRITKVSSDNYAKCWPQEAFRRHGIQYEKSDKVRSEIYLAFLPLLNSARVELLDHKKMINELCCLERRTATSGRDSVNHPPRGGHDDCINSAAGAMVLAVDGPQPMRITDQMLAAAARPTIYAKPRGRLDHPMYLGRGSRIMQASDFNPRYGGPPAPTFQRPAIDLTEQMLRPLNERDPTRKS